MACGSSPWPVPIVGPSWNLCTSTSFDPLTCRCSWPIRRSADPVWNVSAAQACGHTVDGLRLENSAYPNDPRLAGVTVASSLERRSQVDLLSRVLSRQATLAVTKSLGLRPALGQRRSGGSERPDGTHAFTGLQRGVGGKRRCMFSDYVSVRCHHLRPSLEKTKNLHSYSYI
jgi:hypothetical protein